MTVEVILQDAREARAQDQEIPSLADFSRWVEQAVDNPREGQQILIRIVDAAEMQTLNRDYRGKDRPTNVLSFDYRDDDFQPPGYLGDIVICASVVMQEAAERQIPPADHWAHLALHGVLHLLGYDHETSTQAAEMEGLEIELLGKLGIDNPYEQH